METFTVTKDDKEVKLKFKVASAEILIEAEKRYSKTFSDSLKNGGLLRSTLSNYLKEQGVWSDDKQKEVDSLTDSVVKNEFALHKGGISLKQGRELALTIAEDRKKKSSLLSVYSEYDNNTAEGQSDNAKFNYMVYATTVYNSSGELFFGSYDAFIADKTQAGLKVAREYARKHYGLSEDFENSFPENKFLLDYNFVDKDLRFVNEKGQLTDKDGKLVNENGNYVDSKGHVVDEYGYKRDKDGKFADKPKPFLDAKGKPVKVDKTVDSKEDSA